MKTLLFIIFSSLSLFAQEKVFIQSASAKINAEANSSSALVAEGKRGEPLLVSEKKGPWLKVQYKNKTGWIMSFMTSKTPPLGAADIQNIDAGTAEKLARKRSSDYSVSGATKGLSGSGLESGDLGGRSRYDKKDDRAYRKALDKIEEQNITTKDIETFRNEGRLKK